MDLTTGLGFGLMSDMKKALLAGDIGGTKTHLALFGLEEGRKWAVDRVYVSKEFPNLLPIVQRFLKENQTYSVERAAFGIAGPIEGRICKATNLPWVVDAGEIERGCGIRSVFLLNDLEANAYGIELLGENEFHLLNKGKEKKGNRALISAGTGLGEAGIIWDGAAYTPFASEGGHCSFAPQSPLEVEMLAYFGKEYGHVSFERFLSGPGLFNIYRFLVGAGHQKGSPEIKEAKDVTFHGLEESVPACKQALEIFSSIYGNESANLALKIFAIGGVYIGGGIAPKLLPMLKKGGFVSHFRDKGRFSNLLSEIPIRVILNEFTALLGAAYYARERA